MLLVAPTSTVRVLYLHLKSQAHTQAKGRCHYARGRRARRVGDTASPLNRQHGHQSFCPRHPKGASIQRPRACLRQSHRASRAAFSRSPVTYCHVLRWQNSFGRIPNSVRTSGSVVIAMMPGEDKQPGQWAGIVRERMDAKLTVTVQCSASVLRPNRRDGTTARCLRRLWQGRAMTPQAQSVGGNKKMKALPQFHPWTITRDDTLKRQ